MTDHPLRLETVSDPAEWADLLERCRETSIQQTWAYGQAVQDCIGWNPVRHKLIDADDAPAAMAQALEKELPVLGRTVRLQHGPLFIDAGFDPDQAAAALERLRSHWVDESGASLHLTPCLVDPGDLPPGWDTAADFHSSDEPLWTSIRVDATLPESRLLKNMKRRWRGPLKKSEKAGVSLEIGNGNEDMEFFLERYESAAREKGFSWPSPELVRAIHQADPDALRLLFAQHDGERVAAMVLQSCANTFFSLVAWNGPQSGAVNAHNFLIYASIQYTAESGGVWLDLGGIDEKHLPGITAFKRGVGGREYAYLGNWEARPETGADADGEDYRKGLGHILTGLEPPSAGDGQGDDLTARVAAILARFVQEMTAEELAAEPDTSLLADGLIDSLTLVSVVQALQETFQVEVGVADITLDNFDRVSAIAEFVRKRSEG
jgi:acyl carrier protein